MKKVAIIGAGISGLRAGLELSTQKDLQVIFFEKSPSVGGRVATRRMDAAFVNHGATEFHTPALVTSADPQASQWEALMDFTPGATRLPKALRDRLLDLGQVFHFNARVASVSEAGGVKLETGDEHSFDHVFISSPVSQTRVLLNDDVLSHVSYTLKVLFLGVVDGRPQRIEMTDAWSAENFERRDPELLQLAEQILDTALPGFTVKKWRYSQVSRGHQQTHFNYSPRVTLIGDAFDPTGDCRLSAAWLSGMHGAQSFLTAYTNMLKESV